MTVSTDEIYAIFYAFACLATSRQKGLTNSMTDELRLYERVILLLFDTIVTVLILSMRDCIHNSL